MYTQHGWHIDGTVLEDRPIGLLTQNCGGPMGNCTECFQEASNIAGNPPAVKPKTGKVYYTKATVDRLYEIFGEQDIEVEKIYRVIDTMQESGFETDIHRRS